MLLNENIKKEQLDTNIYNLTLNYIKKLCNKCNKIIKLSNYCHKPNKTEGTLWKQLNK